MTRIIFAEEVVHELNILLKAKFAFESLPSSIHMRYLTWHKNYPHTSISFWFGTFSWHRWHTMSTRNASRLHFDRSWILWSLARPINAVFFWAYSRSIIWEFDVAPELSISALHVSRGSKTSDISRSSNAQNSVVEWDSVVWHYNIKKLTIDAEDWQCIRKVFVNGSNEGRHNFCAWNVWTNDKRKWGLWKLMEQLNTGKKYSKW